MMNDNSSPHLRDLSPALRLTTGIEPQQKWPLPSTTTTAAATATTTIATPTTRQAMEKQQDNSNEPKLLEYSPRQGREGNVITIVVQSLPLHVPVKLAFNRLLVETKQMQAQDITSLVATVPPFQQIQSSPSPSPPSTSVTLSICFMERDLVTETLLVSDFTYTDITTNQSKASFDTNMFQSKDSNDFLNTASTTAYQDIYSSASSAVPASYSIAEFEAQQQQQYHQYPSYQEQQQRDMFEYSRYSDSQQSSAAPPQHSSLGYGSNTPLAQFYPPTSSTAPSSVNIAAEDGGAFTNMMTSALGQSTSSSLMSPSYTPHQPTNQTTEIANIPRQSSGSSRGGEGAVKSSTQIPTMPIASYQPYPGLVSRSNLEIIGDLDSMTSSWSTEEWQTRRRLVRFSHSQGSSNKIQCSFQPISASSYNEQTTNKDIVVSCIYWMERNEYYITSVDAIYLLERLMEIKFSVEEKNRIRRNLEGFRPLTVSKCKPESAEFFKIVMSYPNPKPRHIEKDVKAFPWKTLPYALKKIVTKYTANSYGVGGQQQQKKGADRLTAAKASLAPFYIATSAPTTTVALTTTASNNDPLGCGRYSNEIEREEGQSFIYHQEAVPYARPSESIQPNSSAATFKNIKQGNLDDDQQSTLVQFYNNNVPDDNDTSSNSN